MVRKLIVAAAIVALGALSTLPRVNAATVPVSAAVGSTATITVIGDPSTTTWTGAAAQAVPFTVNVVSNDANGYQYTYTGGNTATGAFTADGTATPANVVDYTVTGTGADTGAYTNGTMGTVVYPGPTVAAGVTSTFNINWPVDANVQADTYVDSLTVIVTPV